MESQPRPDRSHVQITLEEKCSQAERNLFVLLVLQC